MGFRRRTREQLAQLHVELEALRAAGGERQHAVGAVALASAEALPAGATPAAFAPPEPGSSLDDVRAALAALTERLDGLDTRQAADHQGVQARLGEVTVLLTNQLGELSAELENGHARLRADLTAQAARVEQLAEEATRAAATPSPTDDERLLAVLQELRTNQVRIANDLARHEISLRQDVATLAELVRRPTTR